MSIRQEHLEAYEQGLQALNENIALGQSLLMDKGSIEKKIETGFNLIGNIGQAYQTVSNTKAILNKGSNVVKKTVNALSNSQQEARTADTGGEEAETTAQPSVAETSFMTPEAEETARTTQQLAPDLEEGAEASIDPAIEAFRDRIAPDLFQRLQQTGLQEGGLPSDIQSQVVSRAFGNLRDLPQQGELTMIDAGATPELDAVPESEMGIRMLEASGAIRQQGTQAIATTAEEAPGLLDQLAPLRQLMARGTQPLGNSEAQQRIADFDPEGDLTSIPNLSADGATRALSGVENTVDEVGNTLTPAIENVASRVGGAVSRVAGTASELGEQAGALASRVGGTVSRLGATASELAPDLAEGLGAVAAGSLEIPVAGEVVALLAGIGSAIASAFQPAPEKPTVAEIGADFSNTDEHGGSALSAY